MMLLNCRAKSLSSRLRHAAATGNRLIRSVYQNQGTRTPALRGASSYAQRVARLQEEPQIVMGCVSYDPSVGDIWDGIKDYLQSQKVPFDYVLFTNYEAQVKALVEGHLTVAWNGPVAHVLTEEMINKQNGKSSESSSVVSLGMRDVDRDFESLIVVRKDRGIDSLDDLAGASLLTGASDSPQGHLVPIHHIKQKFPSEITVTAFDFDMGKHGDTAAGEVKAMEELIASSTASHPADAAVVSKMMWDRAIQGMLPSIDAAALQDAAHVLEDANLPKFDHCQFDAIVTDDDDNTTKVSLLNDFSEALLSMDWNNDKHRHLMKLEGIQKEWCGPRQGGYDVVRSAMGLTLGQHRPATNFRERSFSTMSSPSSQTRRFSSSASPSSSSSSLPRVAVIGAGVAGLQTVRAFKAHGFDVTAFDGAPSVGGLWRENYAGYAVQVPKQLYEFQDFPMENVPKGVCPTGEQTQQYIEDYATKFNLLDSIKLNTKVTSVEQLGEENSNKWKVSTTNNKGASTTQEFDYLIVATGLYSNLHKNFPKVPNRDGFVGDAIHSTDFVDSSVAEGKRVVVVGGAKSSIDCALAASKAGAKSVKMLQRNVHWPTPIKIAGVIPLQYIFLSRFGTALVSTHVGTFPGGSGKVINAFRDSSIVRALMRPVFSIVEALFAFQLDLKGDLRPKSDVVCDFYGYAHVLDPELKKAKRAGKVNVQNGEIVEYGKGNDLHLKDGTTERADLVIFGTGFTQDYSLFSDPAIVQNLEVQNDGLYLYRYILPPKVQNLAFIGKMASISNISTYGLQAEWLARSLSSSLEQHHGDQSTMEKEIEARKQWARSFMPDTPARGTLCLLHQTHYHDQLLRDMGINPHRKSNPIAEYLMPYEPLDYNGIVGIPK